MAGINNFEAGYISEDDDVIVVNKPQGMVVHPAPGHATGTLVSALMYHCKDSLSGINGEIRPGIVHRIDKDTSGLIVVAKNIKEYAVAFILNRICFYLHTTAHKLRALEYWGYSV